MSTALIVLGLLCLYAIVMLAALAVFGLGESDEDLPNCCTGHCYQGDACTCCKESDDE